MSRKTTSTVEKKNTPDPSGVEVRLGDAGTVIGPLLVRDKDVDVPDRAVLTEEYPSPLEGEVVEFLQGVTSTRALALALNGTIYLFDAETVGALKQAVDQGVAGIAY